MTPGILAAAAIGITATLATATENMNWPEIITTVVASLSGFITLLYQLQAKRAKDDLNARLMLLAAETAATKERAEYAALAAVNAKDELQASRKERGEQMQELKTAVAENTAISTQAFEVANGHNAKIVELREDLNKVSEGVSRVAEIVQP